MITDPLPERTMSAQHIRDVAESMRHGAGDRDTVMSGSVRMSAAMLERALKRAQDDPELGVQPMPRWMERQA